MPSYDVLLFDLGGVLVQWVGSQGLMEFAGERLSPESARRFWLESPWVRDFERGRCTPLEFARGVVAELDLAIPPEDFLQAFTSWDRGPFPGAVELLEDLRSRCTLACLSNNNVIHWTRLRDDYGFGKRFDRCFISHEIGLIKPDHEVFEYVRRALGVPPARVLFLDDNPECTEAAQRLGFAAVTVRGVDEVRQALQDRLDGCSLD